MSFSETFHVQSRQSGRFWIIFFIWHTHILWARLNTGLLWTTALPNCNNHCTANCTELQTQAIQPAYSSSELRKRLKLETEVCRNILLSSAWFFLHRFFNLSNKPVSNETRTQKIRTLPWFTSDITNMAGWLLPNKLCNYYLCPCPRKKYFKRF